jgi:hypothetical protein
MNIVKLKDILMPSKCSFADFFNSKLKGKYAYWIQMRYIFPIESLDYKDYIQYEQLDPIDFLKTSILPHIDLYSEECCMYRFSEKYIDHEETSLANDISEFEIANNYVTESNIDITMLRNFRSWLAGEILKLNTYVDGTYSDKLTSEQIHMLEYYKNDMYNDVVKHLSIFGKDNAFLIDNTKSECGCCSTNISGLYNIGLNGLSCDALNVYIKNIHTFMVKTFEDVDFWSKLNKSFLILFKLYIDNIIKTGLTVNTSNDNNLYLNCNCNKSTDISTPILKNLSDALEYIIDDKITNHSNFIHDALYNWAEHLYDKMSWNIK